MLAVTLALVGVASGAAALALHLAAAARAPEVPGFGWAAVTIGCTWPLAGLVVVRRQPRNRAGWLLLATSWLAFYQLVGEVSIWNAYVEDLPLSDLTDWISMWGFAVYLVVLPLVPMHFPDGRLPSPRWVPFAWSLVGAAALLAVARMFVPGASDVDEAVTNPIDLPALHWLNYVVLAMAVYCNGVGVPAALVALTLRTRRAVGVERTQLQWLMLGGVVLLAGLAGSSALRDDEWVLAIGLLGPPLAIAVSVLRHRLFDVDLALSRSAVSLMVIGAVTAGGAWLLLRLDPEVTGTRSGVLLVAVVSVTAVATRAVVQHWIDRWYFPHRLDAALLGQRIARAVTAAAEPRAALVELVGAVRSTLRLPYVGFRGSLLVEAGERPDHVLPIDAVAMGRRVGAFEVAPRRPGEGFTAQERQVLEESAAQAAMLAYAVTLVAAVEESRGSIVRAREEERRRLRNDLHDGVGPALAGIALQADALARRLEREGTGYAESAARAQAIRDRLRETVADVRAVSHGLRPPILDQIGLSPALRQLVAGLEPIRGTARVDELPELPAASEVATYAIAAEAVSNAVRHSAASRVHLDARPDEGALLLTVSDNGRGMPSHPRAGVGLTSMRQRAAEVGGRVEHLAASGGGTVVTATLPLDPPIPEEVPA